VTNEFCVVCLRAALKSSRLARLLPLRVGIAAIATLVPFAAQAQLLPFGFPSCPGISLLCTVNTINALGATIISRRNDFLLGLDPGLDRQIELLSPPGSSEGNDAWPKASALGGPRLGGATGLSYGDTPPYALGATSRPARAWGRPAFGMWAEGYVNRFNDDSGPFNSGGHSGVVYVGADYLLSRYILIGALVQFDQAEQDFEELPSRVSNTGWMAGPYATVQLSDNLFFQARAAWGKSQSQIHVDQNSEDQFDSDRWLVRGTLLGQWQSGPWQFRPRASVGYIEETKESYISSRGMLIPGQTGTLGQAKLGPEIAYQYRLADGTVIQPSLLLEGIWNFEQSAGSLKIDDLAVGPEIRGRAEVGLMISTTNAVSFGASFSYDGIGSGDYHALGGRVRLRVMFN
jgi:autotransporter-like protein